MILPEQLEINDLPKSVRGYSIPDTDRLVNYLKDKYTELYEQYAELEKKYAAASARVSDSEKDEESIRSALINAQKASAKITREANEKADMIVRSTKISCDKIMYDFRKTLAEEKKKLAAVAEATSEFKEQLLDLHRRQMAQIEELTADDSYKELLDDGEAEVGSVIKSIKESIAKTVSLDSEIETIEEKTEGSVIEYEGPDPLDLEKAYERRDAEAQNRMFEKPDQKLFEEAKLDSEIENNPNMTKTFTKV